MSVAAIATPFTASGPEVNVRPSPPSDGDRGAGVHDAADVDRVELGADHVVEQDAAQRVGVDLVERAVAERPEQRDERVVGRREHGVVTGRGQHLGQPRLHDRVDEDRQRRRGDRELGDRRAADQGPSAPCR